MTDADEAYRIAEERIAEAKATGAKALNLSPNDSSIGEDEFPGDKRLRALAAIPPDLAGLTALTRLDLDGTQIADLAPLAGLTALQTLYLSDTQAADLAPLAGLTALQTLDLRGTQAADLAPLAGLTALQTLDLRGTQAADLSPLAGLTALQALSLSATQAADLAPLAGLTALQALLLSGTPAADLAPLAGLTAMKTLWFNGPEDDPLRLVAPGAPWERAPWGLEQLFLNSDALGDAALKVMVEEGRKRGVANAPAILARLREIRDERAPAPPAPPEPRPDNWNYEAGPDGRMRLSDSSLGADADQAAMQADLRRRAEALAGALAGSNEFAELAEDARRYALLLERDADKIGAKAVWALSCIFRAALAADEAAEREGRLNDQLPPLARAALTGVVTIGGAWLLDHPGVAAEEAKARSWRAAPGEEREAEAAAPFLKALAEDTETVEPDTAEPIRALARFGLGGPIGDLRAKAVLDAARGAGVYLIRTAGRAVKWTAGGVVLVGGLDAGVKVAIRFIETHAATIRAWLEASAPEALRYFEGVVRALGL